MKKLTKLAAFVFALCLGATAMTGCGDKKDSKDNDEKKIESAIDSMDEKELESKIEDAAVIIDSAEKKDEEATTEAVEEDLTYAPTDEIKNADFSSGLIQIGNDVFRNGGYYTVNEFIEKYGDRYDMSDLNPDGIWGEKNTSAKIVSKSNPEITLTVLFASPEYNFYSQGNNYEEAKCSVGEAVVYYFITSIVNDTDKTWYPTGLKSMVEDMKYTEVEPFLESIGTVKFDGLGYDSKKYDAYDYTKNGNYIFYTKGSEKNLFGFYPVYSYNIYIDEKNGTVKSIISSDGQYVRTDEWTSAKDAATSEE